MGLFPEQPEGAGVLAEPQKAVGRGGLGNKSGNAALEMGGVRCPLATCTEMQGSRV